jgi:hypothetical protein
MANCNTHSQSTYEEYLKYLQDSLTEEYGYKKSDNSLSEYHQHEIETITASVVKSKNLNCLKDSKLYNVNKKEFVLLSEFYINSEMNKKYNLYSISNLVETKQLHLNYNKRYNEQKKKAFKIFINSQSKKPFLELLELFDNFLYNSFPDTLIQLSNITSKEEKRSILNEIVPHAIPKKLETFNIQDERMVKLKTKLNALANHIYNEKNQYIFSFYSEEELAKEIIINDYLRECNG